MADEANRDLAVLGFSVNAKDATNALGALDKKIRDIDKHFGAADISLEKKINSTLDKMAKSIAGLERSSQSIADISAALTALANVSSQLGTLPEITNTITESVKAMKNSGLEKLAKSYSQSLNKIGTAFAGTNDNIEAALAKMRDIFIKPLGTQGLENSLNDVIGTLDSAKKAFDVFLDSANPKKLPANVAIDNVRNASKYIGGLIHQVKQYQSATNNAIQDPTQGERWEAQADVIKTTFNEMRGQLDKTMKTLMPEHGTVKVNVVFSNLTEQLAKIPSQLTMGFTPEAETRMQGFVASVESLGKDHQLKVDFADGELQKVQDKLDAIFKPVISFAGTPEDTAKKFFDDVQKYFKENKLRMPVKLVLGFGATRKPMASDGDETQEVKKTVEKVQKEAQKEVQKVVEQAAAKEPPKPTLSPLEQWKQDLKTAINQNEAAKKVVEDAVGKFGSKNTFSSMYDYVAMMGDSDKGWLEYFRELLEKLKMTREEMDAKMAEAGFAVDGLPKVAKKKPKAKLEPVKVDPVKVEVPPVKVEPTPEAKKETTESIADMVDPNSLFEQVKAKLEPSIVPLKNLLTFTPEITFTQESEEKAKNAIKRLLGVVNSADAKKISNLASLGAFDLTAYNQSLATAQTGYDAFVAHVNDEANKPQLSFAKNTQGGGIMTQLAKALEGMTVKPQNIIVAPETITVDRSSSIMKFAQKDLFMPIDSMSVEPTTIWVDKANSEVRLLQVPLVADWPDVVVHPQNIFVDTASVPVEKIKAANGAAELPLAIKQAKVTPQSIKVNLSQVPKENMTVTGGTVSLVPQSIKVDLPTAVQQFGIIRLEKPVTVSADIVLKPIKITVKQDTINEIATTLAKPISVDAHVDAINKVTEVYGKFDGAASSLHQNLVEVSRLLQGDMKKLFQLVVKSGMTEPFKKLYQESVLEEQLEREGEKYKEMYEAYQEDPGPYRDARIEFFEDRLKLAKELEKTEGDVANNADKQQEEYTKTQATFKTKLDEVNNRVKTLTDNIKSEAKAMRDKAKVDAAAILNTAKAEAAMRGFSASVTTAGIEIVKLGRIIPTNLTDPFKTMKAELGETGSRLADFGRMFGLYFSGRTVINYFRQAAESANAFGMEIRRIQSLATDFDFTNLRNELMDIDARFGNVIHNANALYWAYSSGVRGTEKELANFVEVMSKTSTTIKSDIMPTVDAATSIMNAWNLSAGSAAEIGDLLFSIIKYGKSNAQQLTTSLGHVVAPAAALNVNLDELGATIATLTKTMKTNRALTYLSNILGKMASPTKQVQEAAAEMGIELSATAIKARGFAQTLADIRRVTGGDIGKIAKLFPDLRGQRAAITLLSTQYKDFEQQLENMRGKAGAMEEALGKITDTPEAQLKAIRNTISMISIGAGDAVNTTITLGGLLGPILEKINKLEHGGRELLGHLTASVGATVGLAVASRALAAAQFGAAQAAYQMAAAVNETHKVELSNALLAEKRLIDEKGLAVAALKRELSEKKNNDDLLRSLREQAIAMKEASQEARKRVTNAKLALNIEDQMLKRQLENNAVAVGESKTRITALSGLMTDLQTGKEHQKILDDANLVKRLQSDIAISQARLSDEQKDLVSSYRAKIQPLVEKEGEARELLMQAMKEGQVGLAEEQKKFLNSILQTIKADTAIAGQMAQYDTDERLIKQETRRIMLAEMQKGLVAGTNYEHTLLIDFVDAEIKQERQRLAELTNGLERLKEQSASQADIQKQLDDITQQTATLNELENKRLEIQTQIEQRERSLTGRGREQLQILDAIQKEAQQKLQHDMEDVEQLQKNLDLELRRASVIGGATLEATKASTAAYMQMHNVVLQLNTLDRERETLIDKEGNLINESAEAAERVAAIDKERVELQSRLVKLQQRYMELGVKAGSERARNMRIAGWNGELDGLVKSLARDKGVVKEAVKAMSAEVGKGIFGGRLGGRGMQGLAIASTMIPGLGRYGMGASMLASMNVFGKAASGMTRLTASVMKLMGTTEKLQKNGVMSMTKGVEDLTKSLMTSLVWTKKQALANKALMGLAGSGAGSQAAMAGAAASATWWTAGLGIGGILAGAIISGMLLYINSEKGGPLGDLAESLYGVDDKKRRGDFWDARQARLKEAKAENDEMIRSMQRISASFNGEQTSVDALHANLSNIQNIISKQIVDGNEMLLDAQRSFVNTLSASLKKNKYDIGALTWKNALLNQKLLEERNKLADESSQRWQKYNKRLYDFYTSYVRDNDELIRTMLKSSSTWDKNIWNNAVNDILKHKTTVTPDITGNKTPVSLAMYDYAKAKLDKLIDRVIDQQIPVLNDKLLQLLEDTQNPNSIFYLKSYNNVIHEYLKTTDLYFSQNELNPKMVDQKTWDEYVKLRDIMNESMNAQVNRAKNILSEMDAVSFNPVQGIDYQRIQTLEDRLKEASAKPDHLLFESLLSNLEEFRYNLPDNLALFASVQTNLTKIMQTMANNRTEINRLKQESDLLQQQLNKAKSDEHSIAEMYKSRLGAEQKIREALDGIANNIQDEVAFSQHVYNLHQKEVQRINTAIAGLKKGNTARTYFIRKQEFTDTLNKINQEIEVWAEVAEGLSHNPMRQEDLANARFNLRDTRERRAKMQQMINNLGNNGYNDFLSGVAEARYQNLREILEADRDAAFVPLQDSGRKLELAKKMTNMAFNRLSYVLGNGKELADLTSKTGEDIQEMVRSIVADLSTPMQKIKDEYDLYNEGLQKLKEGTDPYNEQKAKVDELQTKLDAARKEYQEKTEGIRSALQDFYNREANEVSAYIQDVMEQIKRRTSRAKYFSMFQKGFGNLKVQEENISQLLKVSEELDQQYSSKTGIFAKIKDASKAKETHEGAKRQVDDAIMQYRQSYLEMLRGVGESTASLMENITSDLQTSQKSFFEFQLNDPRNAGIQDKLINQQYGLIGSLLYGKNGVIAMRNKALEDAKAFMGVGDEQEALKALGEAQKYQQKQVGYEQQRLGLVKLKADKEKEINQSLFSLASTLQGKFESTSQTAVDAYSEEAIRLQMRRIGENIAPPVQTSAQEIERKLTAQLFQRSIDNYNLLQQASLRLQQQISNQAQNADKMGNAAVIIQKASDTAQVAAETFKRTVESNRTTFRVKRI